MNHVGSSVNLHIVIDGKILLLRRKSHAWMDGKLQIPGGHVELGESPLEAVLREANEELGIHITAEDVQYMATVAVKEGKNEYFAIQFKLLDPGAFQFHIMESQKCSELVWADVTALPDDTIELFKQTIIFGDQGVQYIELGYQE